MHLLLGKLFDGKRSSMEIVHSSSGLRGCLKEVKEPESEPV